jgi:AhpD family alkylhydroperoxidase
MVHKQETRQMPDPLLKRIPPELLPDDMAEFWQKSTDLRGDATLFEVFGNHPTMFKWYIQSFYGQFFYAGLADQKLKELMRLRLSTLHGCRFCNQGNRLDALNAGVSQAQVDSIETFESGPFSELEKATLRLAEKMALTNLHGELDADLYSELKAFLTDGQILELGMVAGLLTGMAKFMFAFDLVEKEESCPFPHRSPQASDSSAELPLQQSAK